MSEETETERAGGGINIFEDTGTVSRGHTTSTNRQNLRVESLQASLTPILPLRLLRLAPTELTPSYS